MIIFPTLINVTLEAKGSNYTGTVTGTYQIINAANSLSKAKAAKQALFTAAAKLLPLRLFRRKEAGRATARYFFQTEAGNKASGMSVAGA